MNILLIEDEQALGSSIIAFLREEGFICDWAKSLDAAIEKISIYQYMCAIVDITLPDGNGLEAVRKLTLYYPKTGIIILSARHSLDDKVLGLDLGADDYISKPFHMAELKSRINAVIRRKHFDGSKSIVVGKLTIIPDGHELFVNENKVTLTKKEYLLLIFLITNKNRVITREAIAEHLMGEDADLVDSYDFVYSHIKNLRKKIMQHGGDDYIQSIYGMGYKFSDE